MRFACWIPDFGESEGDHQEHAEEDARSAAESLAERLCQGDAAYYRSFLAGPVTVMVRAVEHGYLYEVEVRAEESIDFHSSVKGGTTCLAKVPR